MSRSGMSALGSGTNDLQGDTVFSAETLTGGLGSVSQPAVGIGAHVLDVGLMGPQGGDAGVEEAGDVDPVAGRG